MFRPFSGRSLFLPRRTFQPGSQIPVKKTKKLWHPNRYQSHSEKPHSVLYSPFAMPFSSLFARLGDPTAGFMGCSCFLLPLLKSPLFWPPELWDQTVLPVAGVLLGQYQPGFYRHCGLYFSRRAGRRCGMQKCRDVAVTNKWPFAM